VGIIKAKKKKKKKAMLPKKFINVNFLILKNFFKKNFLIKF